MHTLDDLQQRIGYIFLDRDLLQQALTHRSYANEHRVLHNERLEFLGDAVLQLAASEMLVKRFPKAREGQLSRLRSRLVNTEALATIARSLGLGERLRLGRGEDDSGGRDREGLLADATEAILGAITLDGSPREAASIAQDWMRDRLTILDDRDVDLTWRDPKSELQERVQRTHKQTPRYVRTAATGPAHAPTYTVQVQVGTSVLGSGQGGSFREASKAAAIAALESS